MIPENMMMGVVSLPLSNYVSIGREYNITWLLGYKF